MANASCWPRCSRGVLRMTAYHDEHENLLALTGTPTPTGTLAERLDTVLGMLTGLIANKKTTDQERRYATDAFNAVREAATALGSLTDPAAVRVNILRGTIVIPDDLVWLHDTNGPVAEIRARAEAAEAQVQSLTEALKPFSEMAGELFARNWNAGDIVLAL